MDRCFNYIHTVSGICVDNAIELFTSAIYYFYKSGIMFESFWMSSKQCSSKLLNTTIGAFIVHSCWQQCFCCYWCLPGPIPAVDHCQSQHDWDNLVTPFPIIYWSLLIQQFPNRLLHQHHWCFWYNMVLSFRSMDCFFDHALTSDNKITTSVNWINIHHWAQ